MLKKFAEELKDTRLKKDITLQQISNKTKIDIKFLEAIENGNFEILPEVYLKAFIKSYAGAVGLDETATLKKFDAAKTGKNIEEKNLVEPNEQRKEEYPHGKKEYIAADSGNVNPDDDEKSNTSSRNNILLLLLGLGLIVVVVIAYLVFFSSSSEIITERPNEEVFGGGNKERFEEQKDTTQAVKTDTITQNTEAPSVAVQNDSLNLLLKVKDTTWIRVILDNTKTKDFLLTPNSQKNVRAKKSYRVSVGNAGNVEMFLNNKSLNFVGKNGEVKVVKIDSSGLQYINLSKTPANKTNE